MKTYNWYMFRGLCDDPEKFRIYTSRLLDRLERQYNLYLRNDMTTWDPMVAEFYERQTRNNEDATESRTKSGTKKTTRGGKTTTTYGGSDTATETGTNGNTRTLNTNHNTTRGETWSGSDTESVDMTTDGNGTQTNNLTDTVTDDLTSTRTDATKSKRTDNTQQDSTNKANVRTKSGVRGLAGDLPMSSTYGQGSPAPAPSESPVESLHFADMPPSLNWDYATSQQETVTEAASESDTKGQLKNTGTVETDNTGTVTNKNTGTRESKSTGTVGTQSSATEQGTRDTLYGRKVDSTGSDAETGTVTDAGTTDRTNKTEYNRSTETTNDLADSETDNGTESGSSARNANVRERYSGRRESPPELLARAQDYILKSNALKWLIQQLDVCFMQVLEVI